ncbi:hypothetical protein E4U12_006213 [Claviceps purpurea]|nr:hypothetical protein E4U12_006213 [Claviceps purpurea]
MAIGKQVRLNKSSLRRCPTGAGRRGKCKGYQWLLLQPNDTDTQQIRGLGVDRGLFDDWNYASIFKRQVRLQLQGTPFSGFGKNREELIQMVREKIPKELLEFGG